MTSLPLPASRPCISSRTRLVLTPGVSPSYQDRICLTCSVTRMVSAPVQASRLAPPNIARKRRRGSRAGGPSGQKWNGWGGPPDRSGRLGDRVGGAGPTLLGRALELRLTTRRQLGLDDGQELGGGRALRRRA